LAGIGGVVAIEAVAVHIVGAAGVAAASGRSGDVGVRTNAVGLQIARRAKSVSMTKSRWRL
jgi:hypothetical protein